MQEARPSEGPALISLEGGSAGPTSIRAKSLAFVDPASQAVLQLIERVAPSTAPLPSTYGW